MSKFAILRVEKLKTFGNISASLQHTYRTRPTPNAAPERQDRNKHVFKGQFTPGVPPAPEDVLSGIKGRLPEKRRSDAVLCVEYMITASPEALKSEAEHLKYLADARRWLEAKHGPENVIAVSVHLDETTPHLIAYVVPLDEKGVLNAKSFFGGRDKLRAMQTDFAKKVGSKYGLERGVEGSRAVHTDVKDFYGLMARAMEPLEVPKGDLKPKQVGKRFGIFPVRETPEQVENRVQRLLDELQEPLIAQAKVGHLAKANLTRIRKRMTELEAKATEANTRAEKAEQSAAAARKRASDVSAVYAALTPDQQKQIAETARGNVLIRERANSFLGDKFEHAKGTLGRLYWRVKDALGASGGKWWDVDWAGLEAALKGEEVRHNVPLSNVEKVLNENYPPRATWSDSQKSEAVQAASKREMETREKAEAEAARTAQERFNAEQRRVDHQARNTVSNRPKPR